MSKNKDNKTNDDNALIYSGIHNYINSETYPAYGYLLDTLTLNGSSKLKNDDLDEILSKTVIKKACCRQKENSDDDNYYETDVVLPATSDTQGRTLTQTILVNKSYCDPLYTGSTSAGCSQFENLYCENSKLLYDRSIPEGSLDNPWTIQVPWCENHKSLVEQKAEFEAEKRQQEQTEEGRKWAEKLKKDAIGDINTNVYDISSLLKDSGKSSDSDNSDDSKTNDKTKSNTVYYIIGGVVCIILLILIVVIIVIMNKKKNKSDSD